MIEVFYLEGYKPEKAKEGDMFDLKLHGDVMIEPYKYYELPLGIYAVIPQGLYIVVASRSSSFRKYGILQTNGIGIIDPAYSHREIKLPVFGLMVKEPFWLKDKTRIAQMFVIEDKSVLLRRTTEEKENKLVKKLLISKAGFGSTGEK